jgi:ubiquinone/menaquinone biosynthesis C-methylase UbiE
MDPYEGWADVYDVWTSTTDDVGFYTELAREAGGPVVELGVGNGRVAIPVALADVEVIGVDVSVSMLSIGRKRAAEAGVAHLITWISDDMRTFALDEPVQLVMFPARGFLHLLTAQDQLAALARAREALAPGGRVVLDAFLPRPEIMAAREGIRTHKGSWASDDGRRCELDEILTYDAATQRVYMRGIVDELEGDRVVKTRELQTELRWIGRYEMEHLLARAGFVVEALYGWFDRRPLHERSTEMIWIARRS